MKANHRESGQSIIIIAFIVLVILALLALVVDIGNAYAQRRVVQNAVDAAAMAGASMLATQGPLGPCNWDPNYLCREDAVYDDAIEDLMRDYAEKNGVERTRVEGLYVDSAGAVLGTVGAYEGGTVPVNAMGVRVAGDLTVATYFAHLLGVDEITVDAPGAAYVLTGPCSGDELFPMTVNVATFPDGQPELDVPYIMLGGSPNAHNDNFWWVHWDPRGSDANYKQGPSSQALDWNLADTTRSGGWRVGNWVQRSQGVQLDSTSRCLLEGRILDDGTTARDCDKKMPAITLEPEVTIPIFDTHSTACPAGEDPETCGQPGNTEGYRIVGFAQFRLTCYYHSSTKFAGDCGDCAGAPDKCVKGYFLGWVDEPFDDGCLDTGITAPSYRMPTQP